ncbi:hypothetical protein BDP27DRAFT_1370407 [Rhodocollybia butyracea]|uniref:Glutathione S-transferase n=1 Tax=Rhodocollybia butyracea TaxID=206335 RepID=A0A9P5TYK2_9AGAR|nr:hypothetical protein BDP27DRAFT_1370407 [Rhodocollybia butyracea]
MGYSTLSNRSKILIGDEKEFTTADAAIIPFFERMEVELKNISGGFEEGEGRKAWEALVTEGRFARWRKYWTDVKARESSKNTFDESQRSRWLKTREEAAAK